MTFHKGNDPDAPLERDTDQSLYGMPGWAVEVMLHLGFTLDELLTVDRPRDVPVAEVIDVGAAQLRYARLSLLNAAVRARG